MRFQNRRALITGGLGFIGSNLARLLDDEGASVTVVDCSVPGCGANPYNLADRPRIRLLPFNIARAHQFSGTIAEADLIFNLAGEVSHIDSMEFPERDLEINTSSQVRFLEACRRWNPGVRVVYASTRQVYGIPEYLPVDERHPINPVDYNGVHKYAAGQYHLMLTRHGDLDAISLRLTNVYGPRLSLTAPNQGFLGVFLRRVLLKEGLRVFGNGSQLRDPLYVADCVEAFARAALLPARNPERVFNVGGGEHLELGEIADVCCRLGGLPRPERVPFPEELKRIDIGSYFTDNSLFERATGWRPRVRFADGVAETLAFFRAELNYYWPAPAWTEETARTRPSNT